MSTASAATKPLSAADHFATWRREIAAELAAAERGLAVARAERATAEAAEREADAVHSGIRKLVTERGAIPGPIAFRLDDLRRLHEAACGSVAKAKAHEVVSSRCIADLAAALARLDELDHLGEAAE